MINFIGKTIEVPKSIPGKRIGLKVIWKDFEHKFVVRFENEILDIEGQDDLSESKRIYALPCNRYFGAWYCKLYEYPDNPDPDVILMTKRFWGKYKHGMTIYGKIVDGIFIEVKRRNNESDISEDTTESSDSETIPTVV